MKMKRRIIKERSSSDDALIKQALEAAVKAKHFLDDAAGTIRDAVGETFLFARLDSHSMDLDDTIDDIKAVLAGQLDATEVEYVPESRKRFVKESGAARKGLEELRDVLVNQFGQYSPEGFDDGLFIDDRVEKDDDGRDVLNVCEDPGFGCISQIMKYINMTYGKRFDMVLYKGKNVINLDIYDLEGEAKDKEALDAPISGPKDLPGQMTLPGFNESKEETEWFDSHGDMRKHLPMDCILDCSSGGSVDDAVDYWVNELNFHVPTEKGLSYVREYGIDDIGPEDVDKYVLWIMCGNIKDEAYEFCRGGMDYDDFEKDSYPEDMDDWTEEDWDRFQDEVAICHLGM